MSAPSSASQTTTASASKSDSGPATVYETFTISGPAPSTSTQMITLSSTRTSLLGPLTTTFTTPSRCNQAYWFSASDEVYDPTIGQVCATVNGTIAYSQDSACLPSVTPFISASLVGPSVVPYTLYNYQGYYSPGIACPAGYSTACAAQAGSDGIQSALSNFQSFGFLYTATADETVVGCCPTGYHCTMLASRQWCQHVIASTTQPVITCINGTNGALASSTTQFTLPANVTLSSIEVTSTISLTTLTMLATMVQINFQATDLASITSSLSPTSSLPSSLGPTNSDSSGAGSGSGSSDGNHKTTTIAVSVVIPCVAVLIAASLGWFWYRRRRAKKQQLSASYQAAPQSTDPAVTNSYYGTTSEPSEMLGSPVRAEMEGSPVMHEMAASMPNAMTVRREMYAGK